MGSAMGEIETSYKEEAQKAPLRGEVKEISEKRLLRIREASRREEVEQVAECMV